MKHFIYLSLLSLLFISCKEARKPNATELAKLPADTVRLDAVKNRDMLIILSILPDSITKTFNWPRSQRRKLREELEGKKYFLDSAHTFLDLKTFKNNYIEFESDDKSFALATYQIRDGHYIILAKDVNNGRESLTAHELYKTSSEKMVLEDAIGKYNFLFLNDASNQTCLGMFYENNPVFNYNISNPDEVIITIKNYSEGDSKGCLKGNKLTLKFNKIHRPFYVEGIEWSSQ